MPKRKATFIDVQERAQEFSPGTIVVPTGGSPTEAGRVVAVWPAIGMVDVQFPWGNKRIEVSEIQILDEEGAPVPPNHEDIPGGPETVEVSGGPAMDLEKVSHSVAQSFLEKQALYWADKGRKYRVTRREQESGDFTCPKCNEEDTYLKPCVYKKRVRLLGCPSCLFLIKESDILGMDLGLNPPPPKPEPTLPTGKSSILNLLRGGE